MISGSHGALLWGEIELLIFAAVVFLFAALLPNGLGLAWLSVVVDDMVRFCSVRFGSVLDECARK